MPRPCSWRLYFGSPVSTTHTITGAIVGVGAARKVAAVRWNVASNVVVAWILTMPAAGLIGAAFYQLCKVWPGCHEGDGPSVAAAAPIRDLASKACESVDIPRDGR